MAVYLLLRRALLALSLLLILVTANAAPFSFQAYVEDGGVPISGNRDLELRLFNSEFGGTQIGTTVTINNALLENGLMNLLVDFQADIGALSNYWIEVVVDGDFLPRIPMLPAPLSSSTSGLVGNPIDTMPPMTGDVLKWNGSAWAPDIDNGQVYTSGTGISISGGQISVAIPYRLPQGCASNDFAQWNGSSWVCATAAGGTYTAGAGLNLVGNEFRVDFEANGGSDEAARADHSHYGDQFGNNTEFLGLQIGNSNPSPGSIAIQAVQGGSDTGIGLRAVAQGNMSTGALAQGNAFGLDGQALAAGGVGVRGSNTSNMTGAIGVQGESNSLMDSIGVLGSGHTGVRGSGIDTGVRGHANAFGVKGTTATATGIGVHGVGQANIGTAVGVRGESASDSGIGVEGVANDVTGNAIGVRGQSGAPAGVGVLGVGANAGVRGTTSGASGEAGVEGIATSSTGQVRGIYGETSSVEGAGVFGNASAVSGTTYGVIGQSSSATGHGVAGLALEGTGMNRGVLAQSNSGLGYGLLARNNGQSGTGVGVAVRAESNLESATVMEVRSTGTSHVWGVDAVVPGSGSFSYAVHARVTDSSGSGTAIYGQATGGSQFAGQFIGNVGISGTLSKGGGSFKIDHPLDPENKYLYHSFVESPDMMNIYNGNVETDAEGMAVVTMPDWFESLNREFRYQLTVLGSWARAMVAEEISGNQFVIRTDEPFTRVSWQVTGVRQDRWAEANRIPVEQEKPKHEQGKYLHPKAWGVNDSKSLNAPGKKALGDRL